MNSKLQDPVYNLFDEVHQQPVPNEDTADFINTYFATIGEQLAANLDTPFSNRGLLTESSFEFQECELETLIKFIRNIDITKSSGIKILILQF